jgi:hypothetical protein
MAWKFFLFCERYLSFVYKNLLFGGRYLSFVRKNLSFLINLDS